MNAVQYLYANDAPRNENIITSYAIYEVKNNNYDSQLMRSFISPLENK